MTFGFHSLRCNLVANISTTSSIVIHIACYRTDSKIEPKSDPFFFPSLFRPSKPIKWTKDTHVANAFQYILMNFGIEGTRYVRSENFFGVCSFFVLTHTHTHTHTKCISERVRYIHHDLAPYALSIASGIFSISSIHIHRRCQHNFVSNACTSRTLYHRLYRPSTIVYRCDCIFSRNLFGLKLVGLLNLFLCCSICVFVFTPNTGI